ncbi:hypothetical protein F383_19389 [Gossypium arboreum]|uniref:Uncharacterized protein n=1 Tax=Gossypium arboreum TaxID=29729 RepID=A0A0B0NJ09_GOSAR|nr:hypothetical protein F383_19389 [Gossypium arboreum]
MFYNYCPFFDELDHRSTEHLYTLLVKP